MEEVVTISAGMRKALSILTRESRMDIAITLVVKELLHLRINRAKGAIAKFEKKYEMTFAEFEKACDVGRIENPYSYEVEEDDWNWELSITELEDLMEYKQWLS